MQLQLNLRYTCSLCHHIRRPWFLRSLSQNTTAWQADPCRMPIPFPSQYIWTCCKSFLGEGRGGGGVLFDWTACANLIRWKPSGCIETLFKDAAWVVSGSLVIVLSNYSQVAEVNCVHAFWLRISAWNPYSSYYFQAITLIIPITVYRDTETQNTRKAHIYFCTT